MHYNHQNRTSEYLVFLQDMVDNLKRVYITFTTVNLVHVVVTAMELAENYPHLSGVDKKQLVMEAVRTVMTEHGSNEGVDALLDITVPATIDLLVVASRDGLILRPDIKQTIKKCCIIV